LITSWLLQKCIKCLWIVKSGNMIIHILYHFGLGLERFGLEISLGTWIRTRTWMYRTWTWIRKLWTRLHHWYIIIIKLHDNYN
jgi:predicted Rdx family selenoprotein